MGDKEFKDGSKLATYAMELDKDWNRVWEMCTLEMEGKESGFSVFGCAQGPQNKLSNHTKTGSYHSCAKAQQNNYPNAVRSKNGSYHG